jgi:hypothetical protein
MSSLQLGLALLGAGVIAVLLAQFLWQRARASRGNRPLVDLEEPTLAREPHFGPSASAPADVAEPAAHALDPALPNLTDVVAPARGGPGLPTARRSAVARLDGLLDAIAPLALDQPLSGEQVIAHLPATRRAGGKPVLIEGLDADTGEWEVPAPGRRYGELQAGVQLANRAGALNEIEYSEFVQKVQAFADALGALPDFPDMLEAVARAREIDAFAGPHDAQLVMRLVSNRAAWSLGYVQQHAGRHGFVPGVLPGRLVLPGAEEGVPPLLVLQFDAQAALADEPQQATVRELTLAFDVPQTAAAEQPFAAWCAAGQALALALDATMHDDGGQPFSAAAFEAIGADLTRLYAALAEHELPAGSPAARRLFS